MPKNLTKFNYLLFFFFLISISPSCVNSKKIAYFNDVQDSARITSKAGLESVIQKKDILSISVSSLSNGATAIFNSPNESSTSGSSGSSGSQTAGYLVGEDGNIKYPILGIIQAAGLTQNELENNITKLLIDRKLLFDPIVTSRFLNFRITVLGEVNHPGVVHVPSEQISIFEAIGESGDLTIYGLRDNVILVRQEGPDKIIKRLNLNSSQILKSPYYFLKSNDILYVEAGKSRVASTNRTQQILPIVFSGVSVIIIILTTVFKL